MKRVLVIAAMTLAIALPLRAQTAADFNAGREKSFEMAIAGDQATLQMRFGDMDDSWRRMQISGTDDDVLSQIFATGNPRSFQPQIFYTRGQSVQMNGEWLIVAYKTAPAPETSAGRDAMGNPNNWPPLPFQLTRDTKLELTLLNPHLVSRFSGVRVLDVAHELQGSALSYANALRDRNALIDAATLNNLQQIAQQVTSYTQQTGKLPPLQSAAVAQRALRRFGYSMPSPFVNAATGKTYATNAALSGKTLKQIGDASKAIVFYEPQAASDGKRGVVFADGGTDRIGEAEFARLMKSSTIVNSPKARVVLLYGASALAYLYTKHSNSSPIYYRSAADGRIYYRDSKTHQVIYAAPPASPLAVPDFEAIKYKGYAGYNGRKIGQKFGGYGF